MPGASPPNAPNGLSPQRLACRQTLGPLNELTLPRRYFLQSSSLPQPHRFAHIDGAGLTHRAVSFSSRRGASTQKGSRASDMPAAAGIKVIRPMISALWRRHTRHLEPPYGISGAGSWSERCQLLPLWRRFSCDWRRLLALAEQAPGMNGAGSLPFRSRFQNIAGACHTFLHSVRSSGAGSPDEIKPAPHVAITGTT